MKSDIAMVELAYRGRRGTMQDTDQVSVLDNAA